MLVFIAVPVVVVSVIILPKSIFVNLGVLFFTRRIERDTYSVKAL